MRDENLMTLNSSSFWRSSGDGLFSPGLSYPALAFLMEQMMTLLVFRSLSFSPYLAGNLSSQPHPTCLTYFNISIPIEQLDLPILLPGDHLISRHIEN